MILGQNSAHCKMDIMWMFRSCWLQRCKSQLPSPRYLRTPSTTVAACSHGMLLIREGQQPALAHWTWFPGHANLHSTGVDKWV